MNLNIIPTKQGQIVKSLALLLGIEEADSLLLADVSTP